MKASISYQHFLLLLGALSLHIPTSHGYDIGCLYPDTMPDPFEARQQLDDYRMQQSMMRSEPGPYTIRNDAAFATCGTNCLAFHDDAVLNTFTKARPALVTPKEYHNSYSRMLCIAQCYALLDDFAPIFQQWNLPMEYHIRRELSDSLIQADNGNPSNLNVYVLSQDFHPLVVGQMVAHQIIRERTQDGWNEDGVWVYDYDTQQPILCTANGEKFADTTGYTPRNFPTGQRETDETRYVVEGNNKHWQPLLLQSDNGGVTYQRHIVPHIGYRTQPYLYDSVNDMPQSPDPQYDFRQEALMVLQTLRDVSYDNDKKRKLEFFENKRLVAQLVFQAMREQFEDKFSFEDEILFRQGYAVGQYDALILAWREKVRHDIVRPTTVIKRWGSDVVETYGGVREEMEPWVIMARDFESYLQVQPHSEYPSGSACLCLSYADFTDAFTSHYYNGKTLSNLQYEGQFTLADMTALSNQCGESRKWAGVHFTKSITASQDMCDELGSRALEFEKLIRNGSSLETQSYQGDNNKRPQCGN